MFCFHAGCHSDCRIAQAVAQVGKTWACSVWGHILSKLPQTSHNTIYTSVSHLIQAMAYLSWAQKPLFYTNHGLCKTWTCTTHMVSLWLTQDGACVSRSSFSLYKWPFYLHKTALLLTWKHFMTITRYFRTNKKISSKNWCCCTSNHSRNLMLSNHLLIHSVRISPLLKNKIKDDPKNTLLWVIIRGK